jgi:hypothetical protein
MKAKLQRYVESKNKSRSASETKKSPIQTKTTSTEQPHDTLIEPQKGKIPDSQLMLV